MYNVPKWSDTLDHSDTNDHFGTLCIKGLKINQANVMLNVVKVNNKPHNDVN